VYHAEGKWVWRVVELDEDADVYISTATKHKKEGI